MTKGELMCATATASPDGENATPIPISLGNVPGLVDFVPKPDADHGYAVTKGDLRCATAIASPDDENATPNPSPIGKVPGLANFVPKPDADHG